jgi:hypothetical protein
MPSNVHKQRRSERLLAESEVAHNYLDLAVGARNDLVMILNLEKALESFARISTGIARGRLDPNLEDQILAAQQGLQERLYNAAYAVEES